MTGATMEIEEQIRAQVRMVAKDEPSIGILSTGERLAVALVLNRFDMLAGYTMIEAVERLGADWFRAAQDVQRDGWDY
jgi:methyl coenzyme M reductase beta subunit